MISKTQKYLYKQNKTKINEIYNQIKNNRTQFKLVYK